MADKKCVGLFGELLGHNYKPVIEDTYPESKLVLTPEIVESIRDCYAFDSSRQASFESYVSAHTPYSEKVVAIMCPRCGDIIKP